MVVVNNLLSNTDVVSPRYDALCEQLRKHPLYDAIDNIKNLRIFMEHHVYAVWDFMSLIKSLQKHIAPTDVPWVPPKNPRFANFINQLVLDEESDSAVTVKAGATHASHFESYYQAMVEVGANIRPISQFVNGVRSSGLDIALQTTEIPVPARRFMAFTFDVIGRNKPHLLAAVLAYGRESLVPKMFQSIIGGLKIGKQDAPHLYGYLERHIQLDEDKHGPLVVFMAQELCDGSTENQAEAMDVAEQALAVRLDFWDGIVTAFSDQQGRTH